MLWHMSLVKLKVFAYYNIQHLTSIALNRIGQTIIERSNQTLKDMLNKQKQVIKTTRYKLHNALLTLVFFLNVNDIGTTTAKRHWTIEHTTELN